MKPTMILVILVTSLFVSSAAADVPGRWDESYLPHSVAIPRLPACLEVQTNLEDFPWTQAAQITGTFDIRGMQASPYALWCYLFYDDRALWLGYRCNATAGENLGASVTERDGRVTKDDDVEYFIDPDQSRYYFYKFFTNSLGTLYDSKRALKAWDSHAEVKTVTDEKGWTAVMRIPFSDFERNVPNDGAEWGFNFGTQTGRTNFWVPIHAHETPEKLGTIVFAGDGTAPIRLRKVPRIGIGENIIETGCARETRYRIEAMDANKRRLFRQKGRVDDDGTLRFMLNNDQIHHVNFEFFDRKGTSILSFWSLFHSPAVTHRVPQLRARLQHVKRHLNLMPSEARQLAENTVREIENAKAWLPSKYGAERWTEFDQSVQRFERDLGAAYMYVRTLQRVADARFAVGLESPMRQVMIQDLPFHGTPLDTYRVSLARNEHEGFQAVVIPYHLDLHNASLAVSELKSEKDGAGFKGAITTGLVGHVKTTPPGLYNPGYVGWYPDPILDFQNSADVAKGEHVAFWIDVATHKDTQPGIYSGTLTVSAEDCASVSVPLEVEVWDFVLPDGTHLKNAFTYSEALSRKFYKGEWSEELSMKYYDFILEHRLNIDSLYYSYERDPELMKYGKSRGMNAFNLFYFKGNDKPEELVKEIRIRMERLQQAGVDDIAYLYGFDETDEDQFDKLRELGEGIHDAFPDLPICTTSYDTSFGLNTGLRNAIDWWVPLTPKYDLEKAQSLRQEGKQMWWYICCAPTSPYANWFVESPSIEPRLLMGSMSYKYQVDGFLYFFSNLWELCDEPIRSGPYTDWYPGSGGRDSAYANGDGSIFCPGPDGPLTTIRMENIRDGIEDYEYLHTLSALVRQSEKSPARGKNAKAIRRARQLLEVPDSVVESMIRYTHDPQDLEAFRKEVASLILRLK